MAAVVFLSVVEIAVVDVLLSAPWARVAALLAGLAVAYVTAGFAVALAACPHRLAAGRLTVSYGAAFRAEIPLGLLGEVTERRVMTGQSRTAELSDGVLSVPVMSATNVVLRLRGPARLEAGKVTGTVREIRIHAADPGAAVQAVRGALAAGPVPHPARVAGGKPGGRVPGRLRWLRRGRWAGLGVLLAEVVLVATGVLDWRIAAGILAVTEGTLAALGLFFGAALVLRYRQLRRGGLGRRGAVGGAFFSLVPRPVAGAVRQELSVWAVLARAVTFRAEQGPGEVLLARPGSGRAGAAGAAGAVGGAAGAAALPAWLGTGPLVLAGALVLLYAAAVAAACAVAGRVRPHGVRGGCVVLRWGLHHTVEIPLAVVERAGVAGAAGQRSSGSCFVLPGRAARALVLHLGCPVDVPARMGVLRPVTTIAVPLPDPAAARTTLLNHTAPGEPR
ncbi:hypothetical protein ACFY41_07210 [Streptomyces syringium]|uniref:hypothetical protein n=1 Tax=Streptomyces syringium TaxID=76729 RepID=UPI0036A2377D